MGGSNLDVAGALNKLAGTSGLEVQGAANAMLDKLVVISDTEPSSPTENQLWYDTTTETLKRYDGTAFQNGSSTELWIPAADFGSANIGSPTEGGATGTHTWLLGPDASAAIGSSRELPSDWTTFHADLYWLTRSTNTGDVQVRFGYQFMADGESLSTTIESAVTDAAAGANNTLSIVRIGTSISTVADEKLRLYIERQGGAAGDTYPDDAAIWAIQLAKAS